MSTETKTLTNADAKIQPKLGVKALVQIGMLSAIAVVLRIRKEMEHRFEESCSVSAISQD